MLRRVLDLLRCPDCSKELDLEEQGDGGVDDEAEVDHGTLVCAEGHRFPVEGGIPRLLPAGSERSARHDARTEANFSAEWAFHEPGDRTWGMGLDHRVRSFFLEPLRIPPEQLAGMSMLDAGCGNGSQSVAYTAFGVDVVAVDISRGLERGHAFRGSYASGRADRVHFVQGDLRFPPLADASFDIIHSAGVLHHTPDTAATFHELCRLLRDGGTFYVWLYKHEPVITPVVNAIRAGTTRLSAPAIARVADRSARLFQGFTRALDALGIRSYPHLSRREAALALLDIFGAPYAHRHSFEEVSRWFRDEGFTEVWSCNEGRRGFGVCGRR